LAVQSPAQESDCLSRQRTCSSRRAILPLDWMARRVFLLVALPPQDRYASPSGSHGGDVHSVICSASRIHPRGGLV